MFGNDNCNFCCKVDATIMLPHFIVSLSPLLQAEAKPVVAAAYSSTSEESPETFKSTVSIPQVTPEKEFTEVTFSFMFYHHSALDPI